MSAQGENAATVLMLSDIHYNPFSAVNSGGLLDAADALRAQNNPAFTECDNGDETTSPALFDEVMVETSRHKADFTVLAGDLIVHNYQCRYSALYPNASADDYMAFVERAFAKVMAGISDATGRRPVLVALGNHDSGCGNYSRDDDDSFRTHMAPLVARYASHDPAEQKAIAASFAANGNYWLAALPGLSRVSAAVIDTTSLSRQAKGCSGARRTVDSAALGWLDVNLAARNEIGGATWLIGHIPPGVDVRESMHVARKTGFHQSDALNALMSRYADIMKLSLFGHTHMDEWRLQDNVPLRAIPAISPSNGNLPAYSLAQVAADGTMLDYQVIARYPHAKRKRWRTVYSFRSIYGAAAFDRAALSTLERRRLSSKKFGKSYRKQYSIGNPQSNFLKNEKNWRSYQCSTVSLKINGDEDCINRHLNN